MFWFEPIAIVILWLFLLVQAILFIQFITDSIKKVKTTPLQNWPEVAILVAARNEESRIKNCIEGLLALDYPVDKLSIYIGNDQSEDETAAIVSRLAQMHKHLHLINITGNVGNARAKANVLAQLINQSNAPYIFVTDADIVVNKNWIKTLLPYLLKNNYGLVSGTTTVKGKSFFAEMQYLEWLISSAQIVAFDRLNIPTTAVGNNMAFTRIAYENTGGYEKIPYSVTEDFQLYKHMKQGGEKLLNVLQKDSLNISSPPENLITYLHQRKRWLTGAKGLPIKVKALLALSAMFFPLMVTMLFVNLHNALIIWGIKLLVQTVMFYVILKRLNQKFFLLKVLAYELYININTLVMLFFYILPVKLIWKGRS